MKQKNKKAKHTKILGLNIPNLISMIRVVMIIPLATLLMLPKKEFSIINFMDVKLPLNYFIALILFIISSATDWLDGFIARKYDLITTFGKFIDPIADKLLVNSVVIIFTAFGYLPIWVTLIIILRDIIVDSIRMFLASQKIVLAANNLGKLKTMFQMIGIPFVFLVNIDVYETTDSIRHLFYIPIYIAVFFSAISGIVYVKGGWPHITKSK